MAERSKDSFSQKGKSERDIDVYKRWFPLADVDGDGRVTGQDARKFFARSGLEKGDLAKVWANSDRHHQGYLSQTEFVRAMRLIAMAQNGEEPTSEALARFEEEGGFPAIAEMRNITVQGEYLDKKKEGRGEDQSSQSKAKGKEKGKGRDGRLTAEQCTSIGDTLKRIYFDKVKSVEQNTKFASFFSPTMNEGDFDAKPMVLLLGPYSSGKTTFINNYLLGGKAYPGSHIGPEPTTDRWVALTHGHDERTTPGQTLVVQADKPFSGLSDFGSGLLSKLEGASFPHELLRHISIIDSPGVLSGEKQRTERSYNFVKVCEWFASRCDLIILLFDPHKLDISDEFKQVIGTLKGHDDKIRVVLNKADQVSAQQLMRVYGALMWSLSRCVSTPEVVKVYIGSFNGERHESRNALSVELFDKEEDKLVNDLYNLPTSACDRKINEFIKRIRAARSHAFIIAHLKRRLPTIGNKKEKQRKLMAKLDEEFTKVVSEFNLPRGDMPSVARYRSILEGFELASFPSPDTKKIKQLDDVLSSEIPGLMKHFDPFAD